MSSSVWCGTVRVVTADWILNNSNDLDGELTETEAAEPLIYNDKIPPM